MITEQVRIISALSKEFGRELTINQLSKTIRKSYAFTNKYVHALIKNGILNKKAIGSAIVCSLSYANEQAIGLLTYNSITCAAAEKAKAGQAKAKEQEEFSRQAEQGSREGTVLTAFLHDAFKVIVARDEEAAKTLREQLKPGKKEKSDSDINIITGVEFERLIRGADLTKMTIICNHEAFWRMIAKIRQ